MRTKNIVTICTTCGDKDPSFVDGLILQRPRLIGEMLVPKLSVKALILATLLYSSASNIMACPLVFEIPDGTQSRIQSGDELRLYAYSNARRRWRRLAIQGAPQQTVAIDAENLGHQMRRDIQLPCPTTSLQRIYIPQNRSYAYLATCRPNPKIKATTLAPTTIRFDAKNHQVNAQLYSYQFFPKNHLVFEDIKVKSSDPSQKTFSIAQNAEMHIRANLKRFFTMNLHKENVVSKLHSVQEGPVALFGKLSFMLQLLFFKINLKLNTDVWFSQRRVYVPMVINFPVDAHKYVHPGSGMLYSWHSDPQMKWVQDQMSVPTFDGKAVLEGPKALARIGTRFCRGQKCQFRFAGTLHDHQWSMDFVMKRSLVEMGFFPMSVQNAPLSLKPLGWDLESDFDAQRFAFYFETTGLDKGAHPYDLWIQIQDRGHGLADSCPQSIEIKKLL